jgi:hypothetical protein
MSKTLGMLFPMVLGCAVASCAFETAKEDSTATVSQAIQNGHPVPTPDPPTILVCGGTDGVCNECGNRNGPYCCVYGELCIVIPRNIGAAR